MATTTTQTSQGQVTIVTMVLANGAFPPTQINLRDATMVTPAADGSIQVDAKHISDLMRAGWALKLPSGSTSVPSV